MTHFSDTQIYINVHKLQSNTAAKKTINLYSINPYQTRQGMQNIRNFIFKCVLFLNSLNCIFLLNSGRYNFYYFSIYYIAIIMIILLLIVSDCIKLVFKMCLKRHTTIHLSGECLLVGCSDKLSHKMFVSCCCRIHGSV